uniref:Stomoxyn n=1 Tax=Stomoxys calcitrans TaxID=35570 RepID=STMX_STOCA|nr:RecName: Full=Stomoxyn; Flags: Precursor [Stomoxys calcitrans]AAL77057.1 stomoxyn [Stomoxys calcitrans]
MNFYKYLVVLVVLVLCLSATQTEARGFRKHFNKLVKKVKHTISETAHVAKDTAVIAGSGAAVVAATG